MANRFPGMSALIVEREPLLLLELGDALTEAGCTLVLTARTPREARNLVESTARIDLAVFDLVAGTQGAMPLVHTLLSEGTRVVLTSAMAERGSRMTPPGEVPLVTKPYLTADVLDHLAQKDAPAAR